MCIFSDDFARRSGCTSAVCTCLVAPGAEGGGWCDPGCGRELGEGCDCMRLGVSSVAAHVFRSTTTVISSGLSGATPSEMELLRVRPPMHMPPSEASSATNDSPKGLESGVFMCRCGNFRPSGAVVARDRMAGAAGGWCGLDFAQNFSSTTLVTGKRRAVTPEVIEPCKMMGSAF